MISSLGKNWHSFFMMILLNFINILSALHALFHSILKGFSILLISFCLSCSSEKFSILLILLWYYANIVHGFTSLLLCRVYANKSIIIILIWSFSQFLNKFGNSIQASQSFNYLLLSQGMSYSCHERVLENPSFLFD